jgi:phytoene synthase
MAESALLAGSDFYYASLYCRGEERARLAVVNALHVAIASIPIQVSERSVARLKLNWWHEELTAWGASAPRHHLSRDYLDRYGEDPRLLSALRALVDGLDAELDGHHLSTRASQTAWFDATFGSVYALYAPTCGDETQATVRALGSSIEIAYTLLALQPLMRCQLWRLPEASLAANACTWANVQSGADPAAIVRLIAAETAATLTRLNQLRNAATAARKESRVLRTWARIVEVTLHEMLRDGCRVWLHRVELTPLRKLWCAWRERW